MAVTACWRCCRARLAATGDSVAVRVLACSAPSLKFLKSSGEADLEGLRILSAQGTKDGLGVDDDHVKEEEDLPVPDLGVTNHEVVACPLNASVDTFHAYVVVLYNRRLVLFHRSSMEGRRHGDGVVLSHPTIPS